MTDNADLQAQIAAFFSEKMNSQVSSVNTDLVQSRILDSLGMIDLLAHLEKEYEIEVSLDELEIDDLRTIAKIAEFITDRRAVTA